MVCWVDDIFFFLIWFLGEFFNFEILDLWCFLLLILVLVFLWLFVLCVLIMCKDVEIIWEVFVIWFMYDFIYMFFFGEIFCMFCDKYFNLLFFKGVFFRFLKFLFDFLEYLVLKIWYFLWWLLWYLKFIIFVLLDLVEKILLFICNIFDDFCGCIFIGDFDIILRGIRCWLEVIVWFCDKVVCDLIVGELLCGFKVYLFKFVFMCNCDDFCGCKILSDCDWGWGEIRE